MWHKNHIIRRAAVSFTALMAITALAGSDAVRAQAAGAADPGRHASDPDSKRGDPRLAGAEIFRGQAFDTCHTPSASVMRAWAGRSPFGAAGVYIGGRARACPNQPYLNSSWVRAVDRMGWKLLPVYVGSQSPCVEAPRKRRYAMTHTAPTQRGLREGRDAVASAKRLGMAKHSAVYLDMEAYDNSSTRCAATTLRFIQGWNRAVRAAGYYPGFYSSSDSGIEHMEGARKAGRSNLPEALWFARWRTPASVDDNKYLDATAWQPHRRIHQYDGNVTRTYGGQRLSIDRNLVDAPVAVVP
ncbi:uncharacterized protein DUF1906 [Streptomyces sp. Amel2xB2]|uniref:glycoside hydrolase domain-containing protein n=1 Tax=Streptomyces sp. Amel2xB2 TaxID=1305829 RepID=UPI000DBA1114|nr:glycoside hydrolase domain-containing protein [Streptomyces sp. Amel2xB2]RAJ61880.1 uncharacterized protein DUF1906 [Streptomyces sp. Amel2xB2]